MTDPSRLPLGATIVGADHARFTVWAPRAEHVEVVLDGRRPTPLEPVSRGYHTAVVEGVSPGSRYRYRLHRLDGEPVDHADPASRWQPDGIHGTSAIDDPTAFRWTDAAWRDRPLHDHTIYELHVGTFTREGTFAGVAERLPDLVELGVTAIELMPVWQFPGERNWGYDGVLPYAVQHSYGGPQGLRRLVDAAHAQGIAVFLDVVYNHFGPEGFHLDAFGPYRTERYGTPWGPAVNLDDAGSDEVRRFVVDNAVHWVTDYHMDGLRLDAVHALFDQSATHLLEELTRAVHVTAHTQGRTVHVVAESDLNDPRLVRDPQAGGYGLDAAWNDDFHHTVHTLLTDESDGYYVDYGDVRDLQRLLRDRFAYAGRHSIARGRRHGRPAPDVPHDRFVVCVQNHDQVGNRMLGERLATLVDPPRLRLAAALLLASPFVPLLFMGEEHAETAPFQYFVSHSDPGLIEAVRTGRREEFAAFAWQGEAPDPQAPATFERSRPDWSLADRDGHRQIRDLYRELLRLRRTLPAIASPEARIDDVTVHGPDLFSWIRSSASDAVAVAANLGPEPVTAELVIDGTWTVALDTADRRWGGDASTREAPVASRGGVAAVDLAPHAAVLLRRAPG